MPATPDTGKPVDAVDRAPDTETAALRRNLGVGSIVFMVVAAAAPLATTVANIPVIIATSGTIIAPVYFITAGVLLLLFSVGFVQMSRHVRNAGAFYSYIQAGLGRVPGVGAATLALGSYLLLFVGVIAFLGVSTSNAILNFTGAETPWWVWTLVFVAIVGAVGYRDIDLSAKVLGVVLVCESLIVLILDIAILVQGGEAGITGAPLNPGLALGGAPVLGIMFAFFGFVGFEATAVFRNEAKEPDRTIPRATYLAVILIGAFYALSSFAVVIGKGIDQAIPAAVDDPSNFVLDLMSKYLGPVFFDIAQVLILSSFFATVLSFHNVIARYQFTLSGRGVLPSWLHHVSTKHRAPSRSSLVVTIASAVLLVAVAIAALDPVGQVYTWFSGAAVLGIVTLMTATSIAIIVYFRRAKDTRYWRTLVAPLAAAVGLGILLVSTILNFGILVGEGPATAGFLIVMALTVVVGVVIALVMRARRSDRYRDLTEG